MTVPETTRWKKHLHPWQHQAGYYMKLARCFKDPGYQDLVVYERTLVQNGAVG